MDLKKIELAHEDAMFESIYKYCMVVTANMLFIYDFLRFDIIPFYKSLETLKQYENKQKCKHRYR